MEHLKGFIMALVGTSVSSALIDGFVPEGGLKKFVKYLLGLMILLCLLAPLKDVLSVMPTVVFYEAEDGREVEAYARANAIVSRKIEKAVCDKFSIDPELIDVDYSGENVILKIKWRPGFMKSDFAVFTARNFGVTAEVNFYE